MKNHYLFPIFFICFFTVFSQNPKAEKADELASKKNYAAEIELRKEIMVSLEDTPKMFSTWAGCEIPAPFTFVDCD